MRQLLSIFYTDGSLLFPEAEYMLLNLMNLMMMWELRAPSDLIRFSSSKFVEPFLRLEQLFVPTIKNSTTSSNPSDLTLHLAVGGSCSFKLIFDENNHKKHENDAWRIQPPSRHQNQQTDHRLVIRIRNKAVCKTTGEGSRYFKVFHCRLKKHRLAVKKKSTEIYRC